MQDTTGSAAGDLERAAEQQAIRLLQQGNIEGLETLVQAYQVRAVHTAVLITHERQLAEDVVQDAYLQAYRKIAQFDERRPFGPWFLKIVINAARKAAQRQSRLVPYEDAESDGAIAQWLRDPGKGPESLAECAENRKLLWQALGQLTPNQRTAIVLRYFLDKNEREMIQALGRPSTSIKWWLHEARQRLKLLLRPVGVSEREKEEVTHE